MIIFRSIDEMRAWRGRVAANQSVGLVPTMGALHQGHARCISAASENSDLTAVSIFVNRSQFGDPRDYDTYPRTWDDDLALAELAGADIVFAPDDQGMNSLMSAHPRTAGALATMWEGSHRPGHFDAVVTVVNQLFSVVRPNRARFGEKDRQQLAVIRSWATTEWPAIVIDAEPTVREPDGLALSSRNVRLSPAGRFEAASLHRALVDMRRRYESGECLVDVLVDRARPLVSPAFDVDYFTIVDATSFEELDVARTGAVAIAAASIDGVRLIDNVTI